MELQRKDSPSQTGIGGGLKPSLKADRFLLEMGRGCGESAERELACSGVNKKLGYFHCSLRPVGRGSEKPQMEL